MNESYFCPCCGFNTLDEKPPGTYQICEICFWEDDPIQFNDPNYSGGANQVSLIQGQMNFEEFGACNSKMISNTRKPRIDDIRNSKWKKY